MTMHDRQINNPDLRLRAEWAETLAFVLGEVHPEDGGAICAAYLDSVGAGTPPHTAFGDIRADAAFWADSATPPELVEYFTASLRRLGDTQLGIGARKRLFAELWRSFPPDDRTAFLKRVDADGNFHGGRA